MELAAASRNGSSGSLILAAISQVFTLSYVAKMLGEDEDWLWDLSIDMFPEDGCLRVYGIGEDGVTAFTEHGIEYCRHARRRPRASSYALNGVALRRCSPDAY